MENEFISSIDESSQGSPNTDFMSAFESVQEPNQQQGSEPQQPQMQEPSIEIDDRFKHLPRAEAMARTIQSKYDKLYAEHTNTVREVELKTKYEQFITELMEDDQVFEAFIAERKPELLTKKDTTAIIQEKLKAEFGDFKPTRQEADDDPGGKAWVYFKRLDELYAETKGSPKNLLTLKELKEQRAKAKEKDTADVKLQLDEVKKQNNWNDEQLKSFWNWTQQLSPLHLAKMYNFAMRTMRIPSATGMSGSPQNRSIRQDFLNSI